MLVDALSSEPMNIFEKSHTGKDMGEKGTGSHCPNPHPTVRRQEWRVQRVQGTDLKKKRKRKTMVR